MYLLDYHLKGSFKLRKIYKNKDERIYEKTIPSSNLKPKKLKNII